MKKLNNKGITTIEVLICFVLVVLITVSMYGTISSYNERRLIESYKEQVYSYKNLLTKEIQDDFIKIGLTKAKYERKVAGEKVTYTVDCDLKDGTKRRLRVTQKLAKSSYHIAGSETSDDEFMIEYGVVTATSEADLIEYPLPDLGSSKNSFGHKVYDLSINNVLITVSDDNVLSIYIGFYHPELTTRYALTVVCPIDYITTGSDATSEFNLY